MPAWWPARLVSIPKSSHHDNAAASSAHDVFRAENLDLKLADFGPQQGDFPIAGSEQVERTVTHNPVSSSAPSNPTPDHPASQHDSTAPTTAIAHSDPTIAPDNLSVTSTGEPAAEAKHATNEPADQAKHDTSTNEPAAQAKHGTTTGEPAAEAKHSNEPAAEAKHATNEPAGQAKHGTSTNEPADQAKHGTTNEPAAEAKHSNEPAAEAKHATNEPADQAEARHDQRTGRRGQTLQRACR